MAKQSEQLGRDTATMRCPLVPFHCDRHAVVRDVAARVSAGAHCALLPQARQADLVQSHLPDEDCWCVPGFVSATKRRWSLMSHPLSLGCHSLSVCLSVCLLTSLILSLFCLWTTIVVSKPLVSCESAWSMTTALMTAMISRRKGRVVMSAADAALG